MRANYNRQTRRAARCMTTRRPRPRSDRPGRRRSDRLEGARADRLAISPRGMVLTAYGHDLARLAVSIADELELSGEVIDHLLGSYGHVFERAARVPSGSAPRA